MADDPGAAPKPRPRRRRTDIDPNAPTPKVAYERRRKPKKPAGSDGEARSAAAAGLATTTGVTTAYTTADGTPTPPAPDAGTGARLPLLDDRSPNAWVCPFLRAVGEEDQLGLPVESPDPANRCAALDEAVPQSLRQQELVCLTTGHVNCPRYLRGAMAATEVPRASVRPGRTMSPAVLGSLIVLILAFAGSLAFVASRGGLELAAAASPSPAASDIAAAPSATVGATPTATPAATRAPRPSATIDPSPTAEPTPEPTPEPTATPRPRPTATPTSDRYALLTACPNQPDCWIYVVRRGDNVYSIARYFGVPQDRVYALNPWLNDTGLRAGRELRLPPPTR